MHTEHMADSFEFSCASEMTSSAGGADGGGGAEGSGAVKSSPAGGLGAGGFTEVTVTGGVPIEKRVSPVIGEVTVTDAFENGCVEAGSALRDGMAAPQEDDGGC